MKKWLVIFAIMFGAITGGCSMISNLNAQVPSQGYQSEHFQQGRFKNLHPTMPASLSKTLAITWRFFTEAKVAAEPEQRLPVSKLTRAELNALPDVGVHIIKLGHSSVLLKVNGAYWLLDPVFSERASPFSFIGPSRFHQPPISLDELPPIDKVLISHNHYDHLDKQAVKQLNAKTTQFLVPLGVEGDLIRWGIEAEKIHSFDWWQELHDQDVMVAFTPTQHFSGRGLSDANRTLWGSWVIKTDHERLYFSGDSGYFPGFKDIGKRYGPFDYTLIETGAYDADWADIHMTPEQSVQAHLDLRGKIMIPIHNGTFDLAFHSWYDPLERVHSAAQQQGVVLNTPTPGEIITINQAYLNQTWWQSLMAQVHR
ncbi:MBL fold metallo-hydrolase [Pseudoalteromonas rubra]|uniref:MBL fold metallo-hydrolase n=1 Tax=Pseudoalteromonas rubra TaxID=43658 RepID=UPI003AF0E95A